MFFRNKQSYYYNLKHNQDNYKNLGYNYAGNIFKKTLSPEVFSNPLQQSNYNQLEKLILNLINEVKQIRKQFSIAHDKNSLNIN